MRHGSNLRSCFWTLSLILTMRHQLERETEANNRCIDSSVTTRDSSNTKCTTHLTTLPTISVQRQVDFCRKSRNVRVEAYLSSGQEPRNPACVPMMVTSVRHGWNLVTGCMTTHSVVDEDTCITRYERRRSNIGR